MVVDELQLGCKKTSLHATTIKLEINLKKTLKRRIFSQLL